MSPDQGKTVEGRCPGGVYTLQPAYGACDVYVYTFASTPTAVDLSLFLNTKITAMPPPHPGGVGDDAPPPGDRIVFVYV
jgi:hypothetical protein